jgi:outer membrane protein assembly factor BamB
MIRDLSRSRAFLAGNGVFRGDSGISALAGAEASVQAVGSLLRGELCGWPDESVTTLVDAASPSEFSIALHAAAQSAQDVLLVYYVGRSLRTPARSLALAMRDTVPASALLASTAMLYEQLIELMAQIPAKTKLLILDCATSVPPHAAALAQSSAPIGLDGRPLVGDYRGIGAGLVGEGTAARDGSSAAVSPFTSVLIDAVNAGIPGQPIWLTADRIFASARNRMFAVGLPEPASVGAPNAPVFVFARNRAVTEQEPQGPLYVTAGGAGTAAAPGASSASTPAPFEAPQFPSRTPPQFPPTVPMPTTPMPAPAPTLSPSMLTPTVMTPIQAPPTQPQPQPQPQFQPQPPPPASNWMYAPGQVPIQAPAPAGPRGVSRRNTLIGAAAVFGLAGIGTGVFLATRSSGSSDTAAATSLPSTASAHTFTASGTSLGLAQAGGTIASAFYKTDSKGDAAGGCEVFGFHAADGSMAWHRSLSGTSMSIFAQGGMLICTVENGDKGDVIYALDPATGAQKWRFADGTSYLDATQNPGSTIYVGSNTTGGSSGTVVALEAATGSQLWRSASIGGFVGTPGVSGSSVIVDVSTLDTTSSCFLYSLDTAGGDQNWATDGMDGFTVEGYYEGSTVFAVCTVTSTTNTDDFSAVIYSIDPTSGHALWHKAVGGTETEVRPTLSGGSLLLFEQPGGTAASTLVSVDPATGVQQWSFTVAPKTPLSIGASFEVNDGVVYAFDYPSTGTPLAKLNAVSPTGGSIRWSSALGYNSPEDVLFSGGLAFVPGNNADAKGTGTGGCTLSIFDTSSGAQARKPVPLPGCTGIVDSVMTETALYLLGQAATGSSTGYTLFTYPI